MKSIAYVALVLLNFACSQRTENADSSMTQDTSGTVETESLIIDTTFVSPEKNAFMEFSVTNENTVIRLRDWQKDVPMKALGDPTDTSHQELGYGADTHVGAALHTYEFPGIRLIFFGPKDGSDVWLNKIEVTGDGWSTARGIHVGDPVRDLKGMYPKADNQTTGNPDLYRYQLDDSTIEFLTSDGKVSKIDIIYNIP